MRAPRRTLVVLLVLAGLFVAADRIAVNLAEEKAVEKIKAAEGLASTDSATVDIQGFPFLTQVLDERLERVDVEIDGMTAAAADRRIPVTHVEATLTDVLLRDGYSSAVAEHATGSARISYEDLNEIAPDGIEVSYAGDERAGRNEVKVTASIDIMGRKLEFPEPIYSTVQVTEDDRIRVQADNVPGASIPGVEDQVRARIDFATGISGLPSGLALKDAEVTEKGVRFTLGGTDVPLG